MGRFQTLIAAVRAFAGEATLTHPRGLACEASSLEWWLHERKARSLSLTLGTEVPGSLRRGVSRVWVLCSRRCARGLGVDVVLMLCPPLRAGAAHVVTFGPIGIEHGRQKTVPSFGKRVDADER